MIPEKNRPGVPDGSPGESSRSADAEAAAMMESLRLRATQRVPRVDPAEMLDDVRRTVEGLSEAIYEQQVLQEELRMQNEELLRTQEHLAHASQDVRDLFDHAPVGYVLLNRDGTMLEANRTVAAMLGSSPVRLRNAKLSDFLERSSQDVLFLHLQAVFEQPGKHTCEIQLWTGAGRKAEIRLESAIRQEQPGGGKSCCRTALIDVTGEREARDWKHLAEELRKMVEELPAAAVFIKDGQVRLNRTAETLTGYRREELASEGDLLGKLFGSNQGDILAAYQAMSERGFREPSPIVPMWRSDGRQRLVQGVAHRFENSELWIIHDVTDRILAEEALRESEVRFRQITERIGDAVILMEWETRKVLYCSPAYERIFGRPVEELYRNPLAWLNAVHPDDREEVRSHAAAFPEPGGREVEYRITRPDGSERLVRDRVYPIPGASGQSRRVAVLMEDITERRKAEEDQALLAALVTSSAAAIVAVDLGHHVRQWNPAAERLFGYTRDEILGHHIRVLMPPERREEYQFITKDLRKGMAPRPIETVRLHKDGTRIEVTVTVSLIRSAKGEPIGMSAILEDIRQRKRLERQVTAAAEQEQRRIAMELHDGLGAHLTGTDCRATTFSRSLDKGGHPAEAGEALAIAREIRESIKLLRSLTMGLQPLDDDPCSLLSALEDLARKTSRSGRIKCEFVPPAPDEPPTLHDGSTASHLLAIAREAVHNAVRHSGGSKVTIRLAQQDGATALSVTDDGTGFRLHEERAAGLGIGTMEYRARLIGASFSIRRGSRGGTRVMCVLGVPDTQPPAAG